MPAVRMSDGSVKFVSRNKAGAEDSLLLPCGQCIGCRLERSRQWAMRCLHESSMHESNSFITLTYDDANLPHGSSLVYSDFQKFMKRLRKKIAQPLRFYCGGEYGELLCRPHYHACLFGYDFPDKQYFKRTASGEKIYTSAILESLWPFGHSSVGAVTFESAAYIARYCVAKVTGDAAASHYETITDDGEIVNRVPEFNHMSLKPGIGASWLAKYQTDVFPRDYVIINGVKTKPPKYYDTVFEKENPGEFSEIVARREYDFQCLKLDDPAEYFDERMSVKREVKLAQVSQLKRNLS